jgi:hypothetical protein
MCYNNFDMSEQSIQLASPEENETDTKTKAALIAGSIVLLALFGGAIYFLLVSDKTETIRDIFIILLGFELAVIGIAAVLLIVQTARLINMFQHEIKPVLDAANETMSTLRGTAIFMSDAFVQPVIKINSQFASIKQALDMLRKLVKK